MKRSRGFTLIEIVVALSVLVILLLIALPSFLDRIVAEQIREAMPLADVVKPAVENAWRGGQPMPQGNAAAGLPEADKIVNAVVSSVTLDGGAIHLVFGNRAHAKLKGKTLSLRPAVVKDTPAVPVTWLCGHAQPPEKMTAVGVDRTDVPLEYLPFRCRKQ